MSKLGQPASAYTMSCAIVKSIRDSVSARLKIVMDVHSALQSNASKPPPRRDEDARPESQHFKSRRRAAN